MTPCIENPNEFTEKIPLLLLTNSVKLQGKRSQQCFSSLAMKKSQKEIKKTVSFTVTSKNNKVLRVNLTREVEDLYTENQKTLLEEVK